MAALLSRAVRNARAMMRSAEWGTSSVIPGPGQMPGFAAQSAGARSESQALAIGTVLACVKALHDDVLVLPFAAYSGERDGPHQRLASQPQIVVEPFGPDLSVSAGMAQLVVSKAMRGNAYAYISKDDIGRPVGLTVIHPDAVLIRRDAKLGKTYRIGGETFAPDEIIHISGLMLPSALQGIDVLTYQRTTHDLAWKVNAYADSFFDAGASPAGVISVPGIGDRKRAREVQAQWEASHAGIVNAHRPAVMFGGATWTAVTVTPENAQFLQTRQFLREEICGLYGVPLQRIQAGIFNPGTGGGLGVESIEVGYVQHGLLPAVVGIEQAWDRLIAGTDTWTAFDFKALLRASASERATIAQVHRVTGIRTPDEIRADEGWEPLPDGKGADPHTPLNSNTTSPAGGADNTPKPGGQGDATP